MSIEQGLRNLHVYLTEPWKLKFLFNRDLEIKISIEQGPGNLHFFYKGPCKFKFLLNRARDI